ncbi:ArsR/SmtB family transcription factor [Sulfitobacter sp.]|uniref:ArsR/SmtB family transcription factor n=1 Tax=Sulfitobacter sp. TaxID=1903071 RepID=UPI003001FF9B
METESHAIDLTLAASGFAALGSEQRLTVLLALVRAGPAGLSIGALGDVTGVTGSTLTHHMKILAAAGLVEQTRQGRSIICAAIAYERVRRLSHFLLTECCADAEIPCADHEHNKGEA